MRQGNGETPNRTESSEAALTKDKLGLQGRVEIFVFHHGVLNDYQDIKNIIFYQGNTEVLRTLSTISPSTKPRIINRMAAGDQGTIPSDSTVPKVPTKDLPQLITTNGLYHEVYRKDVDSRIQTFSGATNEVKFIATFTASDVSLSAFSNPSQPRINEIGLVIIDPTAVSGIVRTAVTAPTAPPSDEVILSIRTFKSVPFEVANDVSITIRYTLFME
jgi:hypothetical protein